MSYNCIADAVDLSLELIDGYLGIGTDYFDINVSEFLNSLDLKISHSCTHTHRIQTFDY